MASQGTRAPSTSSRGAQVHCPRRSSASSRLSTNLALLSLGSLALLCYLAPFGGATSPSFMSSVGIFFRRSEMAFSPRSIRSEGGGEGRLGVTWALGASFKVCPLFLLAIRPFRPILCFRSMPYSSSELVSNLATISFWGCVVESLSDSVLESKTSTGLSGTPSSSSRWNWSISASRDRRWKLIPLSKRLLLKEFVKQAARQVEGPSKLKTQLWRRLFGQAWGYLPSMPDLCPEICVIWARSLRSGGRHVIVRLHSRISLISTNN